MVGTQMLSFLRSLPVAVLRVLDTEANRFTITIIKCIMLYFGLDVIPSTLFVHESILKQITEDISLTFLSLIKEITLLIYLVCLRIDSC